MISSTPIWITINGFHLEKIIEIHPENVTYKFEPKYI